MLEAVLSNTIDAPWTGMASLILGKPSSGMGTPACFGLVSLDGDPYLRIDMYGEQGGPFTQALPWAPFIAIGWGCRVYLIEPVERRSQTFPCDGYFGSFYPAGNRLLITTATELICFNVKGGLHRSIRSAWLYSCGLRNRWR